jgi:hypothetical protein
MPKLSFLAALVMAGDLTITAWGADLTKIDRRIAKEPGYRNKPKYCLLVLGPETKTRVWLVIDGDVLYVDRNGNGDLTEKGKRVPASKPNNAYAPGDITEPGRGVKHTGLRITPQTDGRMVVSLMTEGKCRQRSGSVAFAGRPKEAPIIHFHGPLSVQFTSAAFDAGRDRIGAAIAEIGTKGPLKLGKDIPLPAGRRREMTVTLSAIVGTPGLGEGTFAGYKARDVLGQPNERIAVRVAFPNREARAKPVFVEGFLQPDS